MEPTRLLTLTLNPQIYPNQSVVRSINYMGSFISLTDEEYQSLLDKIPDYWNNKKDQLIRFVVFENGSYFCEKRKTIFNYSTRDTEDKIYIFDSATKDDANSLFEIVISFYNALKLRGIDKFYDEILKAVGDLSYIKYALLETRKKLLAQTDFMFLSDYTFSDEETKNMWMKYRQELRDITKTEDWINSNYNSLNFPVSPAPQDQLITIGEKLQSYLKNVNLPPNMMQEMQEQYSNKNASDIVKEFSQITLKIELLSAIGKFNIPMFDLDMSGLTYSSTQNDSETYNIEIDKILPSDSWELLTSNINDKIEKINTQLQQNGIDFTISDLLEGIVRNIKAEEQNSQYTEEALYLINDLQTSEGMV